MRWWLSIHLRFLCSLGWQWWHCIWIRSNSDQWWQWVHLVLCLLQVSWADVTRKVLKASMTNSGSGWPSQVAQFRVNTWLCSLPTLDQIYPTINSICSFPVAVLAFLMAASHSTVVFQVPSTEASVLGKSVIRCHRLSRRAASGDSIGLRELTIRPSTSAESNVPLTSPTSQAALVLTTHNTQVLSYPVLPKQYDYVPRLV